MRLLLLVAGIAGCSHSTPAPKPAPPVPIENSTRSCSDAAAGLERATRGIRPPEESILTAVHKLCIDDAWPAVAIECFAAMQPDDLGTCAGRIEPDHREALFGAIAGTGRDEASLAVIVARLANLKVGIAECDRFVGAVATAMSCAAMPLAERHQLGMETTDFWSLDTAHLPADAVGRMVKVCTQSLDALQQHVSAAGCMPSY